MQASSHSKEQSAAETPVQFATFLLKNRLYGIDVTCVQEIVKTMPITKVPLAPNHIVGLINLRGQLATAVGLRQMFELPEVPHQSMMNVVCRAENTLLSILVDEIGDVIEVDAGSYERVPPTVPESTRRFLSGVYKTKSQLLSVISLKALCDYLGLTSKSV